MNKFLNFILSLVALAIPLSCVVGAILLAMNGIGVWGWFLFASLCFSVKVHLN